jgi:hypothetical protein
LPSDSKYFISIILLKDKLKCHISSPCLFSIDKNSHGRACPSGHVRGLWAGEQQ